MAVAMTAGFHYRFKRDYAVAVTAGFHYAGNYYFNISRIQVGGGKLHKCRLTNRLLQNDVHVDK